MSGNREIEDQIAPHKTSEGASEYAWFPDISDELRNRLYAVLEEESKRRDAKLQTDSTANDDHGDLTEE